MSLRHEAAADLRAIVEDSADGFGWPITVTNPAGTSLAMIGLSTDIGVTVDQETGQPIVGRRASVALAIASLGSLGMPANVASATSKPWVVVFNDIGGTSHTYKVSEAMPDRAMGLVTCLLEAYKP